MSIRNRYSPALGHKLRLASRFLDDEDAYYEIQDPVFDIIVAGVGDGSALINWSEPPPD
jgi:hypothetical protein